MSGYVMALDAGTTSNRCIIFDRSGKPAASAQKEFRQIYPRPGWVEHDPVELWSTQIGVCAEAMSRLGITAADIAAIGITNQRETTIVWDRETGVPVYNAIVWQCRRTADLCEKLRARGLSDVIRKKTGLALDPYFSATKLAWILENVEGAREKAGSGRLLFGTVDTWLIWKLSGGKLHITDYSNASRTMLFNINTLSWDDDILRELGIPRRMLPEPVPSSGVYGYTDPALLGGPIAIAAAAGDQQAALFGQNCFYPGDAKNTYGTGGFLLMNTGEKPVLSENGLITTIAWGLGGKVFYALEGSIFVAGAAVQWLRDEMKLIPDAPSSEECALRVPDTGGVYLVPAFVGLGAPYWDPYARGTIVGITRGTNRDHIVRAALESIAFQSFDVLKAMEQDGGIALKDLKVDGGAINNGFLMQFQADIIGHRLVRPVSTETTALGAASLAGLACGFWSGTDELEQNWSAGMICEPSMGEAERASLIGGWHRAVERSLGWAR